MRVCFILLFLFHLSYGIYSQPFSVWIKDSVTHEPLSGALVVFHGIRLAGTTDKNGKIRFTKVLEGKYEIDASLVGYKTKTVWVEIPLDTFITVLLSPALFHDTVVIKEDLTVTATRTNIRMEDAPLKVEVLGTEEMNEENNIKPGNITSLLGDISGVQLQQSSAVSANTNICIQGLPGKYTQLLRDGMPAYEGFAGSFGILQIPPVDLKQIEIIKGSASTLYGGGAVGGIINLVSKEPAEKTEGSVTANYSSLTERNFNGFCSVRKHNRGATIFTGVTYQNPVDVNKDGFSDVTKIQNLVIHPRLFFFLSKKTKLVVGFSSTNETRRGGDMQVLRNNPDSLHVFFEENKTDRNTGSIIFTHQTKEKNVFTAKGNISFFDRNLLTDKYRFYATQVNGYGELSYLIPRTKNDFVSGINLWTTSFEKNNNDSFLIKDFSHYVYGAFIQNTFRHAEKIFYETGLRIDRHSKYGTFVLPRIATIYKFNFHWYLRSGVALGYVTPSSLSAGNKEHDFTKIVPLADSVKAERSVGANLEINYKTRIGEEAFFYINHAFFYTQVNQPVISTSDSSDMITFRNEKKPITSAGWDTYVRFTAGEFEIYFGYTYTMARKEYDTKQPYITYTPRNRGAILISYEVKEKWRFGMEGSYTGFQYREDGSRTPDYFFMAGVIERRFKNASVSLNCENILDERQTKKETILLPPINNPSFKTLWGPVEGRVFNIAVVFRF